MGGAIAGACE